MSKIDYWDQNEIHDSRVHFVVCAARYQNRWLFSRHKLRSTWDMPGGHREKGETPEEAMRRELWEETGALRADILPICIYQVDEAEKCGMLFYAEVKEIGMLPAEFEMAEIQLMDKLPMELTYPGITPQLFERIQGWLNLQCSPNELWDVYDENRNLTGRLHRRGESLKKGEYHLVVHVWMLNGRGEFLITRRSANKGFPNMWESTGGSALAGDDSLAAALREVKEETGLILRPEKGKCVASYRRADNFQDIWLFHQDFDLKDAVLQPGETTDIMYADKALIRKMLHSGSFVPFSYLEDLFRIAGV